MQKFGSSLGMIGWELNQLSLSTSDQSQGPHGYNWSQHSPWWEKQNTKAHLSHRLKHVLPWEQKCRSPVQNSEVGAKKGLWGMSWLSSVISSQRLKCNLSSHFSPWCLGRHFWFIVSQFWVWILFTTYLMMSLGKSVHLFELQFPHH